MWTGDETRISVYVYTACVCTYEPFPSSALLCLVPTCLSVPPQQVWGAASEPRGGLCPFNPGHSEAVLDKSIFAVGIKASPVFVSKKQAGQKQACLGFCRETLFNTLLAYNTLCYNIILL